MTGFKKLKNKKSFIELTGVYNRRAFMQQCEKDLKAAAEASVPYSIILIDIDYFKRVNDTYGHHIGDRVLMHVAGICQSQLDEDQLFARYGGEEFVLALRDCSASEAEHVGNYLREYLKSLPLVRVNGEIAVTMSLGVAEGTENTLQQLLHKADTALYAAKQAGRDQVQIYRSVMEVSK